MLLRNNADDQSIFPGLEFITSDRPPFFSWIIMKVINGKFLSWEFYPHSSHIHMYKSSEKKWLQESLPPLLFNKALCSLPSWANGQKIMAKIITFATLRKTWNWHYDSGPYFFPSKYDTTFFYFICEMVFCKMYLGKKKSCFLFNK